MTNEVSKKIMCVLMRSGVEIWLEDDRVGFLKDILSASKESKFIDLDGQFINTADISGIFNAEYMGDRTRRRNGEWQDEQGIWRAKGEYKCDYGNWHTRGDFCKCLNSKGYRIPPK